MQARDVVSYIYNPADNTNTTQVQAGLFYCGLTREWNGTCQNARFVCSSPGPLFYLPVGKEVTIAWVNNISSNGLNWPVSGCYDPAYNLTDCLNDAKIKPQYPDQ